MRSPGLQGASVQTADFNGQIPQHLRLQGHDAVGKRAIGAPSPHERAKT